MSDGVTEPGEHRSAAPPPSAESAFLQRLIGRQDAAIRKYLSARVHNEADVADLMQELYLRVAALYRAQRVPNEAFVFTIAANLLKDRFRRLRARAAERHVPLDGLDIASEQFSPERAVAAAQGLDAVRRALEELRPPCRRAFILHRFLGMPQAEVATSLGLSVSMVEKHIVHALAHLHRKVYP